MFQRKARNFQCRRATQTNNLLRTSLDNYGYKSQIPGCYSGCWSDSKGWRL